MAEIPTQKRTSIDRALRQAYRWEAMMNEVVIFCVLLSQSLIAMACRPPVSQEQQQEVKRTAGNSERVSREWRAATYRGLTIGKSTRADMLRIFGEPQSVDAPADQAEDKPNPEAWYVYESGGEFPGRMTVVIEERSGVILRIDLHPESLSKEAVIKHFGDNYITTRYDFDQCLGNEESAPLYETPNGQFVVIEYRERGIAVGINDTGKVDIINYVSKPIGATSSKCK